MHRSPTNRPAARGRGLADLAFLLAFGVGGWLLLGLAQWGGLGPEPLDIEVLPFVLFLVVVVAARLLAFEVLPGTVVSADAAFFVAAAFCLGPLAAGWLVALALTVDSLLRLRRVGDAQGDTPRGKPRQPAYVLYFGGMTGALLFVTGWLFGAGAGDPTSSHVTLLERVFGLGVTLLVVHYALQGVRQVLAGRRLRVYLRQMALPGVLAELSLMPLAVVVLLVYHPTQVLGFSLLAATYLLINFVFNRLGRARDILRQRVSQLETLIVTAGELSRSLQADELVESVARETLAAMPEAEVLELALYDSSGGYAIHRYRREDALVSARVDDPGRRVRWVLDEKQALAIPRVGEQAATIELPDEESAGSWLGVPVVMYGAVEGVLSIESDRRGAFGDDQARLLEAIAGQVAVALQNAHLYELAMVDGLTGLFVRRYFDARIDEEIKRADRFGTVFSVIMMDIDDFKQLNDTHGHVVGDRVLRAIADVVRREMRGVDTASRYGGEEVSIILPRTEMVDAYNQAERIRSEIEALDLGEDDVEVHVTASLGIAAYPDCGAGDAIELVRCADRALYRAKKTGKNRVELYWTDSDVSGAPSIRSV